ncbi:MAG: ImmA/IrrE family metallo-endopeptidase [Limisphaerales bacterium]
MNPAPPRLNAALWRDLESRLGTRDLIEWLEVEAERVAALGRSQRGCVGFSTALLRDRSINLVQTKPYLPGLQTIVPKAQGYVINCSPFQRVEDQRFGIAHEIAHTFWFAPDGGGRPLSPLQRTIGEDPTIEWLCNRGAAAILLPRGELKGILDHELKVLHEIPSFAKRYVVPERLVARRIFHDLAHKDLSVLAVQLRASNGLRRNGEIIWFAPAPSKVLVGDKPQSRVVPRDLLPEVATGTTAEVELDGRWWLLAESASSSRRARPLGNCPPMQPHRAWVGRNGDAWYMGLPESRQQDCASTIAVGTYYELSR